MNHQQAKEILKNAEGDICINDDEGTVRLDGEFTIEELHAILQLLEYTA